MKYCLTERQIIMNLRFLIFAYCDDKKIDYYARDACLFVDNFFDKNRELFEEQKNREIDKKSEEV